MSTHREALDLRRLLIEKTREGPVTAWADRIAQAVTGAGLDTADIGWSDPPAIIAYHVVTLAERHGALGSLKSYLEGLK